MINKRTVKHPSSQPGWKPVDEDEIESVFHPQLVAKYIPAKPRVSVRNRPTTASLSRVVSINGGDQLTHEERRDIIQAKRMDHDQQTLRDALHRVNVLDQFYTAADGTEKRAILDEYRKVCEKRCLPVYNDRKRREFQEKKIREREELELQDVMDLLRELEEQMAVYDKDGQDAWEKFAREQQRRSQAALRAQVRGNSASFSLGSTHPLPFS